MPTRRQRWGSPQSPRSRLLVLLSLLFLTRGARGQDDTEEKRIDDPDSPATELRDLDDPSSPYRTPRSGEGFRANVFGEDVVVTPRDRRFVSAFDLGIAATTPGADENELLPFGSLYFWHHPDDDTLFRATIVALFNEVFYAHSPEALGPFEWVLTFESLTPPVALGELIDGRILDAEKMYWGYVRPGAGIGYRRQLEGGEQDNMFSLDLTFEPSLLYFARDPDTGDSFHEPDDTFEGRFALRLRHDALTRNLLELPHEGFAFGSDLVYGFRTPWHDWGTPGTSRYYDASDGREFLVWTAYALGVSPVPFVESERHRLIGSVYGGLGDGVDRFSAQRIGGGPDPRGEEYGAMWRPFLPGTAVGEFYPENYVIGTISYRWEPIFFTYLSALASIGYLDRERRRGVGITTEEDVFTAVGARLTTGFAWETRLQIGYSYSFDAIRQGHRGGHEVWAHLSWEL